MCQPQPHMCWALPATAAFGPAHHPSPTAPAQPGPPPSVSCGPAQPWLTTEGLVDGGGLSVSHAAGEPLFGPLARGGHLADGAVEAGSLVEGGGEGRDILI